MKIKSDCIESLIFSNCQISNLCILSSYNELHITNSKIKHLECKCTQTNAFAFCDNVSEFHDTSAGTTQQIEYNYTDNSIFGVKTENPRYGSII